MTLSYSKMPINKCRRKEGFLKKKSPLGKCHSIHCCISVRYDWWVKVQCKPEYLHSLKCLTSRYLLITMGITVTLHWEIWQTALSRVYMARCRTCQYHASPVGHTGRMSEEDHVISMVFLPRCITSIESWENIG